MIECWAKSLGKCSSKLSREHVVSKSLFLTDQIEVQGFPWCKDEKKTIGLSSFTAKILCTAHNNSLSPIDEAAAEAFDTIRRVTGIEKVRERSNRRWRTLRYVVNGSKLERWFLKTLINLSVGGEYPIGSGANSAGVPSDLIVQIAFGEQPFPGRGGLYSVAQVGQTIYSSDVVRFAPLIKDQVRIEGGMFWFRGLLFMLCLEPGGYPARIAGLPVGGIELSSAQLTLHDKELRYANDGKLSQVIGIDW